MKLIVTLIFITQLNINSYSQDIIESSNFVNKITKYRLETISGINNDIEKIERSISTWFDHENCQGELYDLLRNINLNLITYGMHHKYYKSNVLKTFKKSKLAKELNEYDLHIIYNNPEFFDLIFNGFLKPEFPYPLKLKNFKKEIEFLDIKSNEVYGEIDINSGTNALLYSMYYDSLKIKIFVPNKSMANYTNQKFERIKEKITKDNIDIMKYPDQKNISENNKVDYLVIRNTFQHCTSHSELLDNYKSLLKPEGKLIITSHFNTKGSSCIASMTLNETINIIEKNGFHYLNQISLDENLMVKFALVAK